MQLISMSKHKNNSHKQCLGKIKGEKMKNNGWKHRAAYISYAFTEVAAIYPITPSSTMAELVDEWAESGLKIFMVKKFKLLKCNQKLGQRE